MKRSKIALLETFLFEHSSYPYPAEARPRHQPLHPRWTSNFECAISYFFYLAAAGCIFESKIGPNTWLHAFKYVFFVPSCIRARRQQPTTTSKDADRVKRAYLNFMFELATIVNKTRHRVSRLRQTRFAVRLNYDKNSLSIAEQNRWMSKTVDSLTRLVKNNIFHVTRNY